MYVNVGVINTVTDEPSILSQLSLSNNVTARVMNAVTIDAIDTVTAGRQLHTTNDSDMEWRYTNINSRDTEIQTEMNVDNDKREQLESEHSQRTTRATGTL